MKKIIVIVIVIILIVTGIFIFVNKNTGTKSISVGAKNFTEQYVVGNMMSLLLEKDGFRVKQQFGTGSSITRDGLITGQTDLYAEYTGTAWQVYLKHEDVVSDPVELYNRVKAEDAENGIVWLDRWPLNNTYALGIKKDLAEKYGKSISALGEYINSHHGEVLVGLDSEFYERPDGFFAMAETYGIKLEKNQVKTMDIGLSYEALNRDQVNVAMVFSTDGLLKKYDLLVLEDNKGFFPVYNLAVSIRKETLEKYPEIEGILKPLSTLLDDATMQDLNYKVDAEGLPAEIVAKNFLKEKGLIK